MAGYVKGSKGWYESMRERLVFIGDLLKSPLTSKEEKEELHMEQVKLMLELFDYEESQQHE